MRKVVCLIVLAFALWTFMFSPWTSSMVNFWQMMSISAFTLTVLSTLCGSKWWKGQSWTFKDLFLGATIAVVLWGIFWIGNEVSSWLFDFARPQVNLIYGMKEGESPWVLSLLLLVLIGPAEEIFWRGYVQHQLSAKYNPDKGFLVTTLCYTLVHIASFNFMLIMSSMVCGIVWGILYRFMPQRLPAIILSHALWDAAVFVWFPI